MSCRVDAIETVGHERARRVMQLAASSTRAPADDRDLELLRRTGSTPCARMYALTSRR